MVRTRHLLIEGMKDDKIHFLLILPTHQKAFSKTLFGTISCEIIWKILLLFCLQLSLFTNLGCYQWLLLLKERQISSFSFVRSSFFTILVTYHFSFCRHLFHCSPSSSHFFLAWKPYISVRYLCYRCPHDFRHQFVRIKIILSWNTFFILFSYLTFEDIVLCCLFSVILPYHFFQTGSLLLHYASLSLLSKSIMFIFIHITWKWEIQTKMCCLAQEILLVMIWNRSSH